MIGTDITGQRFGKLVAIGKSAEKSGAGYLWQFSCDCGSHVLLNKGSVVHGLQGSCGCQKRYTDKKRGAKWSTDITGQRFGKLKALRLIPLDERKAGTSGAVWECQCDCGTLCAVRGTLLRYGQTTSCGCAKSGVVRARPRAITVGEKFDKLTVVSQAESGKQGTRWLCRCACGGTTIARAKDLRFGNTRSCGCAKRFARKMQHDIIRGSKIFT